MFCGHCGKEMNDEAVICVGCGCSALSATLATNPDAFVTDKPKVRVVGFFMAMVSAFLSLVCISLSGVRNGASILAMMFILFFGLNIAAIAVSIADLVKSIKAKTSIALPVAGLIVASVLMLFYVVIFVLVMFLAIYFIGFATL